MSQHDIGWVSDSVIQLAELPTGWAYTRIGDISNKCTQRKPADEVTFIYIDIGSIDRDLKRITEPQRLIGKDAPSRARKIINSGDVLVSLTRPNLNAVALINEELDNQVASTGFEVIKPIKVNSKYLFAIVRSKGFIDAISGKVQGALYPAAKSDDVREYEFPLPPLAEQQQIAAKLDELLAQVDTLKTRLDTIPKILKRFRQSVLAAAVSGRLTEDWRNENIIDEHKCRLLDQWLNKRQALFLEEQKKLIIKGKIKTTKTFKKPSPPDVETKPVLFPHTWELVSVSQFADCLDHFRIPIKKDDRKNAEGLYPYFGANGEVDRIDEYLFDGDLVLVTEDETFYGRVKPIAYRYSGKCWVNNHVHVLRAPTKDANEFLCYTLMYYDVIPWLTGTTGRAKLTQAALNSLPMGLPSEEEQSKIVQRVEQLFTYADQIEQRVKDAQARVNHLTQAILAKAFRGELTADWREQNPDLISGENSAAALLARIKAERQGLETNKASHRRTLKKVK